MKSTDGKIRIPSLMVKSVGKQLGLNDAKFLVELVPIEIFKFSFLIVFLVRKLQSE